jgi:hypothetical protein
VKLRLNHEIFTKHSYGKLLQHGNLEDREVDGIIMLRIDLSKVIINKN